VQSVHQSVGEASVNEKQLALIVGLQDRMNIILDCYDADPTYAPPAWTFDNVWHTLEAIKRLTGTES
jgi:hypothetical protein